MDVRPHVGRFERAQQVHGALTSSARGAAAAPNPIVRSGVLSAGVRIQRVEPLGPQSHLVAAHLPHERGLAHAAENETPADPALESAAATSSASFGGAAGDGGSHPREPAEAWRVRRIWGQVRRAVAGFPDSAANRSIIGDRRVDGGIVPRVQY